MKIQTSITVDEEIFIRLKDKLRDGSFRNKSHLFEFAVRKLLEEGNEK
jgi:Arc/MetJ-type ribon-helix-helix transcriptional regulator